jgi:hypothetical protein
MDYVILSLLVAINLNKNTFSLGTVAISNVYNSFNPTFARVLTLTIFCFTLANVIHLSTACLTRLASIFLIGTIEEVNGEITLSGHPKSF